MSTQLDKTSKFLSYILRHKPEDIGITLDSEGWVALDLLITQANEHGQKLNRALIEQVVATSDKKRFTLSEDGLNIRAAQGHSTGMVEIQYKELTPPEYLYHGTATRFINSIKETGLKPGSRHHVHLSADEETASSVGQRHGKLIILKVKALTMHNAGYKFYLSDNHVWLTDRVPVDYLLFE